MELKRQKEFKELRELQEEIKTMPLALPFDKYVIVPTIRFFEKYLFSFEKNLEELDKKIDQKYQEALNKEKSTSKLQKHIRTYLKDMEKC